MSIARTNKYYEFLFYQLIKTYKKPMQKNLKFNIKKSI